jgi:AraC-like DNA-binding protein
MREEILSFPYLPEREEGFGVSLAGVSYCDGGYHITRRGLPVTVVEYVRRGRGEILHNGVRYTACAGDVYLLHRGCLHDYRSSAEDPWEKIWFNLYGALPERLLAAYGLSERVVLPGCGPAVGRRFDLLLQLLKSGGEPERLFDSAAVWLLRLSAVLGAQAAHSRTPQQLEASEVRRVLDLNSGRPLGDEALCSRFHLSRSTLYQRFKAAYGVTPAEYQRRARLQEAKQRLLYSGASVQEVAAQLGFADQHYFADWFRKRVGVSPSAFRRQKPAGRI